MSDTDNDKPKLGARAPLGLKRTVETGKVKQSFSHGRSNTVVVEVKRRRVLGRPGEEAQAPVPAAEAAPPAPAARPASPPPAAPRNAGNSLLSRQELQAKLLREAEEARMTALEEARRREERERQESAEEEARRRSS
ncbi:translation initiation factor IF-2 associated domain-containing protein, partial [Sphingomonas sp. CCH21-G11]|uniref:translation initiation factor IF-2 associated domain-containing protein n=1 Tax=Sphingomonas sp. CCH21-G11 TaxID=1768749 RepID=UPI0018D25870